ARISEGQGKTDGIAVGSQIAEKLIALRSADGADARMAFSPKTGPGLYELTPPNMMPAILPQWGAVTPFVLRNNDGLSFKGPPATTSAAFVRVCDEVKSLGQRTTRRRGADKPPAAIFWTVKTVVPWFAAARTPSAAKGLSVFENASLFTILSMATADSQIVVF